MAPRPPFRPLGDRILLKPVHPEYKGRIIIPKSLQKKDPPEQGEVLACGPGMLMKTGERWPMPVKPGDVVIFYKSGGTDVKIEGETYKIIRDDDVLAVLVPDQES